MGAATSVVECTSKYSSLKPIDCNVGSVELGKFSSNPSITGIGTEISFVLTAGLSLLACLLVQIVCDRLRYHKWRRFLEPIVVSFSDQQIIRGISLSIATLYTSAACTIDAYRYNMICYYLLMTIVSHLSAVLVLRSYTNGHKFLSAVRFGLVGVQIIFAGFIFSSRLTTVFPTSVPDGSQPVVNSTLVLPAVCFQLIDAKPYSGLEDIARPNKDLGGFAAYIIIAIFYFISTIFTIAHIFTHYLKPGSSKEVRDMEDRAKRGSLFWWLGVVRFAILLAAWIIWVWAIVELCKMRAWINGSGWLGDQGALEENSWTFGQLLSVFLLAGAPLSVLNAWTGYRERADEEKSDGLRKGFHRLPPLYEEQGTEFQRLMQR